MNLNKNFFSFTVNFNRLLLFLYFICFGFYGALVPSLNIYEYNSLYHLIFEILIISIPIIFISFIRNENIYTFKIKFQKFFNLFFFIHHFFILNLYPLDYELFSDEQSYVLIGHIHSIEITKKLVNFYLIY